MDKIHPSHFLIHPSHLSQVLCCIVVCKYFLDVISLIFFIHFNHYFDTSRCSCGHLSEDALHYFLVCPLYNTLRFDMYYFEKGYDLNSILNGNPNITNETNLEILKSVHNFILLSGRFEHFTQNLI